MREQSLEQQRRAAADLDALDGDEAAIWDEADRIAGHEGPRGFPSNAALELARRRIEGQ